MARILTGIQSSGVPHLGNILGAITPAIELSKKKENESFFFIADLHSLMLPQIFRISSPVFGIHFSLEYQTQLEKLLSDLPKEIFTASDSLGWVYQFWQSKRKDEINKSEVKIEIGRASCRERV